MAFVDWKGCRPGNLENRSWHGNVRVKRVWMCFGGENLVPSWRHMCPRRSAKQLAQCAYVWIWLHGHSTWMTCAQSRNLIFFNIDMWKNPHVARTQLCECLWGRGSRKTHSLHHSFCSRFFVSARGVGKTCVAMPCKALVFLMSCRFWKNNDWRQKP